MKSLLDLVPEVGKILDNLISTPEEKREAELRLREIDIREVEARLGVQKEWLGNKSVFVAGAIPMILWMVSLVIFFNHVVAPLLAPVWSMPILSLPDWYAQLAGATILGLFGKKSFDNNEIRVGSFYKPAKGSEIHDATTQQQFIQPETPTKAGDVAKTATTQKKQASASASTSPAEKEDTNTRFEKLAAQYGYGLKK